MSTILHCHVTISQNCFMENLKERSFTFERTCFDITFCTGSGRRTSALEFAKNSNGVVPPPVATDDGRLTISRNSKSFEGPVLNWTVGQYRSLSNWNELVNDEVRKNVCVSWILLWLGRKTPPPRGVKQWHDGAGRTLSWSPVYTCNFQQFSFQLLCNRIRAVVVIIPESSAICGWVVILMWSRSCSTVSVSFPSRCL